MKTFPRIPVLLLPAAVCLGLGHPLAGQPSTDAASATYRVRQTVKLAEVPAGTKQVKWWIAIPDDERHQDVLDFAVISTPGPWRIVTEPDHGNRFMLVEVDAPKSETLEAQVEFTLRRQSVFVKIDPSKVGAITESHRRLFADELRRDAPHMEATSAITTMAREACGAETNVARQARLLLDAVADRVNHYSIDSTVPKCSPGDAAACMEKGGGCCTDLHSLFIALARARGIPARLQMGYRLREPNADRETDPGYRCWVEYFIPGYGWIPSDIVEADDPKGLGRDRWFTGLTERRLWLNQGREFDLAGRKHTAERVNTMVIGYAEIDGKPVRVLPDEATGIPAQITRTVFYTEVDGPATVAAR